jgi:hypothetical protein
LPFGQGENLWLEQDEGDSFDSRFFFALRPQQRDDTQEGRGKIGGLAATFIKDPDVLPIMPPGIGKISHCKRNVAQAKMASANSPISF